MARRQDLLREVTGGISLGGNRDGGGRGGGRCHHWLAALVAEATARQVGVPARRAYRLQARAAAATELGARGVVLPALRAAHVPPGLSGLGGRPTTLLSPR